MFKLSFKYKNKDMFFYHKCVKYFVDYNKLWNNLGFLLDSDIIIKNIKIKLI